MILFCNFYWITWLSSNRSSVNHAHGLFRVYMSINFFLNKIVIYIGGHSRPRIMNNIITFQVSFVSFFRHSNYDFYASLPCVFFLNKYPGIVNLTTAEFIAYCIETTWRSCLRVFWTLTCSGLRIVSYTLLSDQWTEWWILGTTVNNRNLTGWFRF